MPRAEVVSRVIPTTEITFTIVNINTGEFIKLTEKVSGEVSDLKRLEKYCKKYYDNKETRFLKIESVRVNQPQKHWLSVREFLQLSHVE